MSVPARSFLAEKNGFSIVLRLRRSGIHWLYAFQILRGPFMCKSSNFIFQFLLVGYSRSMDQPFPDQETNRSSNLNRFRRHPRVRIAAPFICALFPVRSKRWLRRPTADWGVVYDLSLRGARVSTQAAIRPGDEVALSLRLPKQIRSAEIARATVRWTKDQFCGLSFTRLSVSSYCRLKKYVAIASGIIAM